MAQAPKILLQTLSVAFGEPEPRPTTLSCALDLAVLQADFFQDDWQMGGRLKVRFPGAGTPPSPRSRTPIGRHWQAGSSISAHNKGE